MNIPYSRSRLFKN